ALGASSCLWRNKVLSYWIMSAELKDILELSVAERIQLVEDIWDSIAAVPETLALTDDERQELDRRLEAYAENPDEGISWNELKKKVRKSA
ncbi:MAG TPA: addiction module protein, partial [Nitrososphaera sp.]|nr:addiction module protein [Nitrososphaera sp.]